MVGTTTLVEDESGCKGESVPTSRAPIQFTDVYKVSNPEKRPKTGRGVRASTSVGAMTNPGQIAQVVEKNGSGSDHKHAAISILELGQPQGQKRASEEEMDLIERVHQLYSLAVVRDGEVGKPDVRVDLYQ
ncbi:hypothetical protein V6N13_097614 [Hibiscus sabdariffa]